MSSGDIVGRRYRVRGRVQGVFFRDYTRRLAGELGVVGRVRNLPDGSVEALAAATGEDLERFENGLRRGSPASRVEQVAVAELSPVPDWDSFEITY